MHRSIGGLILALFSALPTAWAASVDDFIEFSLPNANGRSILPGRLYVPPEATFAPRPLMLFLHGSGEQGLDNVRHINQNIDNLLAEAKQRGAYLYAPQTNFGWSDLLVTTRLATMLDRALAEHNIDPNRLYVTGISLGGGGVVNMLNRYPERFAAAVPIVGSFPHIDFMPANLLEEAIWVFHPRDDGGSRYFVNQILNAAAETPPTFPSFGDTVTNFHFDSETLDFHYTEPATGGHGYFVPVYAFEPMYDWMFAHGVLVPEPSTIGLAVWAVLCSGWYCKKKWGQNWSEQFSLERVPTRFALPDFAQPRPYSQRGDA